jgi:DNA polymerase I-like protein with 3'-5' exonuclease and polymerase domains
MECVEPILQVHDEVVLEFDEDLPTLLDPLIQAQLSGAAKLRVPVTASGAWGKTWKELK